VFSFLLFITKWEKKVVVGGGVAAEDQSKEVSETISDGVEELL
jgi:hypothetical protein